MMTQSRWLYWAARRIELLAVAINLGQEFFVRFVEESWKGRRWFRRAGCTWLLEATERGEN